MRRNTSIRFATTTLTATAVLALSGAAQASGPEGAAGIGSTGPETITLTGTVRDFKDRQAQGGHPDFQRQPTAGFAHYVGMVADTLDADGKPVYASTGFKLTGNWKNAAGKNICPPRSYIETRTGDRNGSIATSAGGALTTSDNFAQWFRDVRGVNTSQPLDLTLTKSNTGTYVFDDKTSPLYQSKGGFFPINGELYGNYSSTNKNFHFTFELQTEFTFHADAGLQFTFTGDDDVWVYIDDKLVIDIGGVHSAVSQTIELDRLTWLEDGQDYKLSFFFAERHTTQSNFRIETTLELRSVELPPTAGLYD